MQVACVLLNERDLMGRLDFIEHNSWIMLMAFFITFCLVALAAGFGVNPRFLRSQPAQTLVSLAGFIPLLIGFILLFSVVSRAENRIIRFFAKLKSRKFIRDLRRRLPD